MDFQYCSSIVKQAHEHAVRRGSVHISVGGQNQSKSDRRTGLEVDILGVRVRIN